MTEPVEPGVVGRDLEFAILRSALDASRAGRPTIVLVVGEPGIGKSRLVDEAAVGARAAGMRVLRGEADSSSRVPMELWNGVYRSLGVDAPADPTLAPAERRWEHLDVLTGALTDVSPALVVLEDLHWADEMAVWVLEHLPRSLGAAPVAILTTSRDDEPEMPRLDALRRVSRLVRLGGLDVDAVRALASAHVPSSSAVDAVGLHARTGGNPLFVRELLFDPDGGAAIGEVLDRALARFDPATRELLAAASLAGSSTPVAILAAAMSITSAQATERLAPALAGRVLDEVTRAGVRFRHALLSDAAGRWADSSGLHDRLAAAWEATGGLDGRASAATHRLLAASDRAAADAVGSAIDVATDLMSAGLHARAVGLLRDACAVSAECVDLPDLRASAHLDLADSIASSGDFDLAVAHYQQAAELLRDGSDARQVARSEIGLARLINPILPDPPRAQRLEDALASLPADELRLRAALLGRLAVVGSTDPDAHDRSRAWADEAVEVARRTADPVLIVQALLDRHISPKSRAELDAREAVAAEVIALSEKAGRGDLAIQGHQWRFVHHLSHGNLASASRALDRAEILSQLQPSPAWRHSTLIRRTTLHALVGDREAATSSMLEAVRVGTGCVDPLGVRGFEIEHRQMLIELYGGTDPVAEELCSSLIGMVGEIPVAFLQVQLCHAAQTFGIHSRTNTVLQRYGREPDRLLRSLAGDRLVRVLGEIVIRAQATEFAPPVFDTLRPFAGLFNVGGGASVGFPVDDVLGRLAAMIGDAPAAIRHARDAVALARSLTSPPMLVHCLDHLADALELSGGDEAEAARTEAGSVAASVGVVRAKLDGARVARPPSIRAATMKRDVDGWVLTSPLGAARMPHSTGLTQLARLLSTPGAEVTAVELAGGVGGPVAADLGPALDAQAKRAYRRRLLELQADVDDAESNHDPFRAERAQAEVDALMRELERAVGLGGRDRPTGSGAERARVNVVRSLKRAINAIGQRAPDLGAHLDVSVRTGRYCAYAPEPAAALAWTVTTTSEP